jgi:hypothetical protein
MNDSDQWGRDPSVQFMKGVFKRIEADQKEFLGKLNISCHDLRIRRWREEALGMFERAWGVANRKGILPDDKTASAVYVRCLGKVIGSEGNDIPENLLPMEKEAEVILKGVFK